MLTLLASLVAAPDQTCLLYKKTFLYSNVCNSTNHGRYKRPNVSSRLTQMLLRFLKLRLQPLSHLYLKTNFRQKCRSSRTRKSERGEIRLRYIHGVRRPIHLIHGCESPSIPSHACTYDGNLLEIQLNSYNNNINVYVAFF